jgi:hypothetical protein
MPLSGLNSTEVAHRQNVVPYPEIVGIPQGVQK